MLSSVASLVSDLLLCLSEFRWQHCWNLALFTYILPIFNTPSLLGAANAGEKIKVPELLRNFPSKFHSHFSPAIRYNCTYCLLLLGIHLNLKYQTRGKVDSK